MKKEEAVELADKCLNDLVAALEQGQTDVLEKYLGALARFHHYSFGNMMMIVAQLPEASKVAGFPTWRKLGRWVKKGESGIAILAPMVDERRTKSRTIAWNLHDQVRSQCLVSKPSMCSISVRPRAKNCRSFQRSVVRQKTTYCIWRVCTRH